MITLKNSLSALAFVFAITAAFAFSFPSASTDLSVVQIKSYANDALGNGCENSTENVTAPNCLITNPGAQCSAFIPSISQSKFIFANQGCALPYKRP